MTTTTRGSVRVARFKAMGTDAHVLVVGGSVRHLMLAQARVADLESRWTRFRSDSELNRLNRACGAPVVVSRETFELVARAVAGWRLSHGWFDPTVLPALLDAGYDRDFAMLDPSGADPRSRAREDLARPAPGCAGIALDPVVRCVTLPHGVALDAGGVGKGLAADVVVTELIDAGAAGACVNLGGDLRVGGDAPGSAGWCIALDDGEVTITLRSGGVASSSRLRRRWWHAGREQHHLIDPRTGKPARTPLHETTVIAGEAARAEVLATAALVAGPVAGADLVRAAGAAARFVDASRARPLSGWEAFAS